MDQDSAKLKDILESLYARYNRRECIDPDPLGFVWRYEEAGDREIAGLLAALLAYGRVRQIHRSVTAVLDILGAHPGRIVRSLDDGTKQRLISFRHRFNTGKDLVELLEIVGQWLRQYGSIEAVFCDAMKPEDANVMEGLRSFYTQFWQSYRQRFGSPGPGMKFLLSGPESAAKRMHLYLRWMVRQDDVDPGVWTRISPKQLLMPLDTHILRLTRILGFHHSKTATLKTVRQVTDAFARICPEDPVKYDFALSRIGILENCTGRYTDQCRTCELVFYCGQGPDKHTLHRLDERL